MRTVVITGSARGLGLEMAKCFRSKKKLYKASLANQKATYISLLTDVANTYINIFDIYEHSNISNENIGYLQEKIQNLNIFFKPNIERILQHKK